MKYDHKVKYRGKWYPPGTEIPNAEVEAQDSTNSNGQRAYTKSEIARMPVDELRQLALKVGIGGAAEMNGTELKQYILSAFGM